MNEALTKMVLSRFHASLANNINQRLTAELAAGLVVALEESLKGAVLVPPPAAPADPTPAPN